MKEKEVYVYPEDLMVDDWVSLRETDGDYPASNCQISFKDLVRLDSGYLEAKPIPLTDEILEKNGFHKGRFDWSGYQIAENLFLIHSGMYSMHSYEFVASDLHADNDTGIYIDYVHELQHILKQCEIKKKIEV